MPTIQCQKPQSQTIYNLYTDIQPNGWIDGWIGRQTDRPAGKQNVRQTVRMIKNDR